jgi:hypothetical protein
MYRFLPMEYIKNTDFSGYLSAEWDREKNCFQIRFLFDKEEYVRPLIITVKVKPILSLENCSKEDRNMDEKIFEVECAQEDYNNPLMSTGEIEFQLQENNIEVINVKSKISCNFGK